MFINQKKAKLMLRREAGYSVARADEAVEKLSKTLDGKREKVRQADVSQLIAEANKPTPPIPVNAPKIRKFRPELIRQIEKLKNIG